MFSAPVARTSPRRSVAVVATLTAAVVVLAATASAADAAAVAAPAGAPATTRSAAAPTPSAATPAATVTQDVLPTVQIDGVVWAQATVGNTVYVVGKFSSARPAGAPAGQDETPRGNILAYDIRTGVLRPSFDHTLNAQGLAVTPSPDGSRIYVAGQFTQVDGQARYRVAAFSTTTGELLPYAPAANATVQAVGVMGSTVYLGGGFSVVDGNARGRLAATDASGALLPWAPTAAGLVRAVTPAPDGGKVYLGGSFSSVNGSKTYGVSAVDPVTGATIDVPVSTDILATSENSTSAGVISLRTDGTLIYGTGFNALSVKFPQLEGTFAFDPATGRTAWVNDCWGDTYDATPVGGALYVASHSHNCAASGFYPDGPTHYFGLAYGLGAGPGFNTVDLRQWDYSRFHPSSVVQWNPTFTGGTVAKQSVWSFTGNDDYVSAGGEFPKVNRTVQQGLARFAVHRLAPNLYPPTLIGAATAQQVGRTGAVTVTATSAWDTDDGTLRYDLVRDGDTANPVATTTLPTVGFWQIDSRPAVTLTDPAAAAGRHTYAIRAVDGGGGAITSAAAAAQVVRANFARGKTATQSSTLTGSRAFASLAVDGIVNGRYPAGSVTHTNADPHSWWQVDLGVKRVVGSVDVFNRTGCCSARLGDYYVFVSATPFDTSLTPVQQAAVPGVWSKHLTTQAGSPSTVAAPATGRYVMVQLATARTPLTLAEVQVFGR